MVRTLRAASEWARLTGRHKLAVTVLGIWAVVTGRIFLSFDPSWITAQQGNYSTLTIGAFGFAAASLGLTKWADVQMAQTPTPPAAGVPG